MKPPDPTHEERQDEAASAPSAGAGEAGGPYAALRLRDFRLLLLTVLAATVAVEMQAVVVGWYLYALTRDPLVLGIVGFAEALPYMGVALFAGHVADRHDRRRVALAALATLALVSAALFGAIATGALTRRSVIVVYALIAAGGAARSFLYAARSALAAELVPRALYLPAVTWMSSAWQTAAIAGPALGGLLYGAAGAAVAAGGSCALLVLALGLLVPLRYTAREAREGAVVRPGEAGVWRSMREGLRFVWRDPLLFSTMGLDLFAVFFGGVMALLPVFAADILRCGPGGLGVLRAAPAAGAIATALVVAHRAPLRRAGPALLAGVAVFGVATALFAISRSYWLSLVLLAVSGMADEVSIIVRSTVLQQVTPRELLGRVNAVKAIFLGAANDLGAFESGVAARLLGTVPSVLFGSAMTLVAVAAAAWRVPALRHLRRLDSLAGQG